MASAASVKAVIGLTMLYNCLKKHAFAFLFKAGALKDLVKRFEAYRLPAKG